MLKTLENPFYYLDNFQQVLDWIGARYGDLLSEDERDFITTFAALPQAARALFVRMVMRKGVLFRSSKLSYAEIGCPLEAAAQLLPTGWIELDPLVSLDQLFDLLSKPELARLFRLSQQEQALRKDALLAALRLQYGGAHAFSAWCGASGECAVHLLVKPLCDRLRLIFFGNAHQDWLEFVLSDLGVYRYEKVEFSTASRGFRSRRDIDDYLHLRQCKERFLGGAGGAHELQALTDKRYDNAWLASRHARVLFQLAQHFEKQRDWAHAHALYTACGFPGARARAIRVLEKDGQLGAAYALFKAAQAHPANGAELQHLRRLGPRLARRLGHACARAPAGAKPRELALVLPPTGMSVELAVRDHLARPEAPVFYVENALINGLFGLLCWEAVFAPIPGAFFHPFHRGPADLYSADFHQRRAALFDECLARLDDGRYADSIRTTLRAKRGIQSPFLAWEWLTDDLLELALACIPAQHLKKWFERILLDVQANRSGFPDLIQFWPAERRYQMIEVKGPGDRLQDNQLRWLAYCCEHGMPVAVCYLQWTAEAA